MWSHIVASGAWGVQCMVAAIAPGRPGRASAGRVLMHGRRSSGMSRRLRLRVEGPQAAASLAFLALAARGWRLGDGRGRPRSGVSLSLGGIWRGHVARPGTQRMWGARRAGAGWRAASRDVRTLEHDRGAMQVSFGGFGARGSGSDGGGGLRLGGVASC